MYKTVFLLFVTAVSLMACKKSSVREERSDRSTEKNTERVVKDALVKDPLIEISTKMLVHWDAEEERIRQDSLFMHLSRNFEDYKFELINSISDTSSTRVSACYKQNQIRKGDIAFMVLSEVRDIPLFKVFRVQFDVYDVNCRYPEGLFDYIEENRELVKNQTYEFLSKEK
jgi:hypothetical protein